MNILFCGDKNMCEGIFLSALSICKNASEKINIFILTAGVDNHRAIPKSFADRLGAKLNETEQRACVKLIDISSEFASYLPLANMNTRFTPFCMLRLFADKVNEIPDKILYLDTDVLCLSDFKELYDTDMGNHEIAGVPDRYGKWFFGNIFKHNYLNSGVLLINMANVRDSGLFEKCRSLCRDKKMFMPDQSALNKLAEKRKISGCYNEQGKIKDNTVFKHFTTFFRFFPYFKSVTVKPWNTDEMHNVLGIFEFDDIIDEYQRSKDNE